MFLHLQIKLFNSSLIKYLKLQNHVTLLAIISKCQKNNNQIKVIKNDIKRLLYGSQPKFVTNFNDSPDVRQKMLQLNSFKHIIHELYEYEKLINHKQYQLLNYLYMEEDMITLSAYEVFIQNREQGDFIENILLIDKLHYFKSQLDFDEIEQFNDLVQIQLSIVYGYRKHISAIQRVSLQKVIRAGDLSVMNYFKEFRITENKPQFIQKLRIFADQKHIEIKILEQQIHDSQKDSQDEVKYHLDTLHTFKNQKLLGKIQDSSLLEDLINGRDQAIISIFEIYKMNKNKSDLIENLEILDDIRRYNIPKKIQEIVKQCSELNNWSQNQIQIIHNQIASQNPVIMGAYQVYSLIQPYDSDDFMDTLDQVRKQFSE